MFLKFFIFLICIKLIYVINDDEFLFNNNNLYSALTNNFSEQSYNKTVQIGRNVVINCKLSITTKISINVNQTLILTHMLDYEWYKNSEKIYKENLKYKQYPDGYLEIPNVTKDDIGIYKCVASYENNKLIVKDTYIQVIDNERTKISSQSNKNKGDNITLSCFKFDKDNLIYKWYKDDVELDISSSKKYNLIKNSVLQILNVNDNDFGVYKCTSKNVETNFNLKTAKVNSLKKRSVVSSNNNPLIIPKVLNLTHEFITAQIIKIKWKLHPNDIKNTLKFRLFYQQSYLLNLNHTIDNEERYIDLLSESIIKSSETSYEYLLEELHKYSKYSMYLVAISNNYRPGEKSNEIIFQTPSDVPDSAPENVQIDIINASSVMLKWASPPIDKCNGVIKGYKISIKENDKQLINLNVDSKPESKLINGLSPGKKYSLRILAYTVNGTGPPSDWLIAQTYLNEMDESKPPGQPIDLFAEATDKAIKVHWIAPADSNRTIIRRYLLKYGIFIPDTAIQIDGNKDSYLIENLVPSSQYILSLRAGNNAGFGQEIFKEVLTKRKSAISEAEYIFPPLNLQAKTISPEAIELTWTDWHLKSDEEIPDERYYIVKYNIAEDTNPKYYYRNSTERMITINDLKSNTLYDFAVKLVVSHRESDWSLTSSQMTMEASKAFAPREIKFKADVNLNHEKKYANVVISWKVPQLNSSAVDLSNIVYVISYADEKSFKENKWKQEYITRQSALNAATSSKNDYYEYIDSDQPIDNDYESDFLLHDIKMQAQIRKLKLETIYYFKIQERNNREYLTQSKIVLFKTPNINGKGARIINYKKTSQSKPRAEIGNMSSHSNTNTKYQIDINFIWIVVSSIIGILIVILLLVTIILCKRSSNVNISNKKHCLQQEQQQQQQQQLLQQQNNYETTTNSTSISPNNIDLNSTSNPSQKLLINTNAWLNNSTSNGIITSISGSGSGIGGTASSAGCNGSIIGIGNCASSFIGSNHSTYGVTGPGAVINANNLSTLNEQHQHYQQTYSISSSGSSMKRNQQLKLQLQAPQRLLSNEINLNYDLNIDNNDLVMDDDDIYNENNFLNAELRQLTENNSERLLCTSLLNHDAKLISNDLNGFENAYLRQQQANMRQQHILMQQNDNMQRKQFKNLPTAAATMMPSNVNSFAYQQQNSQKLQYTARPYMIDNQVISDNDMCSNSTCSSSTNQQSLVYDKIGNVLNEMSANKNFSNNNSVAPMKSFSVNYNTHNNTTTSTLVTSSYEQNSHQLPQPPSPSQLSMPKTPHHLDNINKHNMFNLKSPHKKLIDLSNNRNQLNLVNLNKIPQLDSYLNNEVKIGDDIYDKKLHNHEELTVEMANLEGIMKDLTIVQRSQCKV